MRNIFTKSSNNFNGLSGGMGEETINMEPSKEVLMFVSQFAKAYYWEKRMKDLGFLPAIVLN
jgi:hypothetical protein